MSHTQTENYRYEHDMMKHHHGYNLKYGMNSPQVSSNIRMIRSPYNHFGTSMKTPQNENPDKRFAPAVVTASTPKTMKSVEGTIRPSRSNSLELKERNTPIVARKIFASPEDHLRGMYEPPRRDDISPQGHTKHEYYSPREDVKLMQQRRSFFAPPSSTRTSIRSHPPSRVRHRTVLVSHISPRHERNESYRDDYIDRGLHLRSNSYSERDHPNEKEMKENSKRRVQSTEQMIHVTNRSINHIHMQRHRHHYPHHPSQKRMETRPQEISDIHIPLLKHDYSNTETHNSPHHHTNHLPLDSNTNSPRTQEQKKLFSPEKKTIDKDSKSTKKEADNSKTVNASELQSSTASTKDITANESNVQVKFKHDGHVESENLRHVPNPQYEGTNSSTSFTNSRSHAKTAVNHGHTSMEREEEYFHNARYQSGSFDSLMGHPSDYHPRYPKRSNRHSPYPHPNNGDNDYHGSLYLTLSPGHTMNPPKDKHAYILAPPPYKNINYRGSGYLRESELSPMELDEKENVKRIVYNPYKYEYHPSPMRSNRMHPNHHHHHRPRNLDHSSSSYHEPQNDMDNYYYYRHHRYRHEIPLRDHDDYRNRYYEDERYYPPMHRYYEEDYDHCDNYQTHPPPPPQQQQQQPPFPISRMEVKIPQESEKEEKPKKRKSVTPPTTVSQRKRKKMYSDYVGVTYNKTHAKFQACITHYRKQHYLGRYKLAVDAAKAYDQSAKMLKGSGWKINFKTNEEYEIAKKEEEERNRKAMLKKEEKKDTVNNDSMNVEDNKNDSQEDISNSTESSLTELDPKTSSTTESLEKNKETASTEKEKQDSNENDETNPNSVPSQDVTRDKETVIHEKVITNDVDKVTRNETDKQNEKPSNDTKINEKMVKEDKQDSNNSTKTISNVDNSPKCAKEPMKEGNVSKASPSKKTKEDSKKKNEVSEMSTNEETENSGDSNASYPTQQAAPVLQNGTLEAASALMTLIQRDLK